MNDKYREITRQHDELIESQKDLKFRLKTIPDNEEETAIQTLLGREPELVGFNHREGRAELEAIGKRLAVLSKAIERMEEEEEERAKIERQKRLEQTFAERRDNLAHLRETVKKILTLADRDAKLCDDVRTLEGRSFVGSVSPAIPPRILGELTAIGLTEAVQCH